MDSSPGADAEPVEPPAALDVSTPEGPTCDEIRVAWALVERTAGWEPSFVAWTVLDATAWVRKHPGRSNDAVDLAVVLPDLRVAGFLTVIGSVLAAGAIEAVATGLVADVLNSFGQPHIAWLLAGASAMAFLVAWTQDAARLVTGIRRARRVRRLCAELRANPSGALELLSDLERYRQMLGWTQPASESAEGPR